MVRLAKWRAPLAIWLAALTISGLGVSGFVVTPADPALLECNEDLVCAECDASGPGIGNPPECNCGCGYSCTSWVGELCACMHYYCECDCGAFPTADDCYDGPPPCGNSP
jgi:hypothetical protein